MAQARDASTGQYKPTLAERIKAAKVPRKAKKGSAKGFCSAQGRRVNRGGKGTQLGSRICRKK